MNRPVKTPFPFWLPLVGGSSFEKCASLSDYTPNLSTACGLVSAKNRAFDISRAKKEIGYDPRIGLDEGLNTQPGTEKEGFL